MTDTKRLAPVNLMLIHAITEGDKTLGWFHTHGLEKLGLPELEIRDVQLFLARMACGWLNCTADYLLNDIDGSLEPGHTLSIPELGVVEFAQLAPIPGQEEHYECVRLALVDPHHMHGHCEHPEHGMEDANGTHH